MKLVVLGSSSKGNCYLLKGETETLVIEAGIRFDEVYKALDYDLSSIVGCIVSHKHGDHAHHVREYTKRCINTLMPEDMITNRMPTAIACESVDAESGLQLGGFRVYPFAANHDVPCFYYIIYHKECGVILFATDTTYIYALPLLDFAMIEANYDTQKIWKNYEEGRLTRSQIERVMQSHMSISTAELTMLEADRTNLKKIVLLHLSSDNSNARDFVKRMEGATGISTFVAKPGLEVEFNR